MGTYVIRVDYFGCETNTHSGNNTQLLLNYLHVPTGFISQWIILGIATHCLCDSGVGCTAKVVCDADTMSASTRLIDSSMSALFLTRFYFYTITSFICQTTHTYPLKCAWDFRHGFHGWWHQT